MAQVLLMQEHVLLSLEMCLLAVLWKWAPGPAIPDFSRHVPIFYEILCWQTVLKCVSIFKCMMNRASSILHEDLQVSVSAYNVSSLNTDQAKNVSSKSCRR
jgi:hypothetical protein